MPADYEELLKRLHDADRHSQQRVLGSRIFDEAAQVITELLAERGGCDPDGCKGHIDAFMRRAEAAEAERDAMAVQLAYANVAQEQEG